MNQLFAIRCFARVVETSSFTLAADSLGVPKPTVSKVVKDLEVHLGVRLLQRTTRVVSVTADGQAYYDLASRLVRDLEDIDTSFGGANGKPRGKIRVDIGGIPAREVVLPRLPEFFKRYPEIVIDFGVGDRAVDLIRENVDCVIRGGVPTELSLVSRLLGTASWTTCATPLYLEQYGIPKHPRELASGHRIVGFRSGVNGRAVPSVFVSGTERIEVDGPYAVSVNDGASRVAAGRAGLGIMQAFTFVIKEDLASGALVPILEDWSPPRYPFHVVFPPNRNLSNRARVFIDWLVETFEAME
jgi:LysR family transcriptional regulator for bpeEF and oprC